ncbi:MAG: oligoendopeptidase F [Sphaerochaetaceae bacterium]|nr:oligoendopeptidase F [Sphaerochaetaceae bacterium]
MKRCEQKIENTWDLTALCKNEAEWEERFKALMERITGFAAYQGKLAEGDNLYNFLVKLRDDEIEYECIANWAFLNYSADASDAENQRRAGMAESLGANLSQNLSWFEPELLELDKKMLEDKLKEERFKEFRIYLEKILRFSPYTLSKKEERLLALSIESGQTAQNAFQDLNNVDLSFEDVAGEKLTHASYSTFIRSEDEKIRKEAFTKYYREYEKNQHVISRLYAGSIQRDIFISRARGYKSSLDASLFPDNVPEEVYKNLIKSVHKGFPILHRYYAVMAKVLKKEKLNHYDVYVPLVSGVKSTHTYDEAVELIKNAVAPLGKEYQETIVKGLTSERWVDRYENEGKRSGAFSAGCFTGNPYILMSYKDEVLNSVFTLIHEGGHSMHSYYSTRNNPFMHYDYSIFEAEVASTFNEQLLARYLINTSEDDLLKAYLISNQLSDIVATLFRQTMFAEYELLCHEAAERGEALTFDFFRKSYRALLEEYFGPNMVFEEASDLEGLRIPHFYNAFYVYKYSTGISAAIALANRVTKGGDKEREDYLSFLKSGGSSYPIESLKKAGVDMSSPEPVDDAIRYFESLLDEFEHLINK